MVAPENREDVLAVCREHKDKGWEYIYDRIVSSTGVAPESRSECIRPLVSARRTL
jgi:hypothetical protein